MSLRDDLTALCLLPGLSGHEEPVAAWLRERLADLDLTTRTDRAQYFAVVLYGLALVERALETYGERFDDDTRVALFERWERFWALSVLESHGRRLERGHPDAFRGIRGASRTSLVSCDGTQPVPPAATRQ